MHRGMPRHHAALLALMVVHGLAVGPALALTFDFTGAVPANVQTGFNDAAARWSSALTDSATVRITIGYAALGPGILGSANSTRTTATYANFKAALAADSLSADDATAVANLPAGASVNMLINYTSNSPFGAGNATPYLDNDGDANNSTIRLTTANAKALGLIDPHDAASDASITFSSNFSWDFDPSDGITPGTYDFVGVATHEIGHALGFISGVDILDTNSPPQGGPFPDNAFTYVAPGDLYRYSASSFGQGAIDWTADNRVKYFSLDGGTTNLQTFSTSYYHGDGSQASHWKDNLGIGIMDPTAAAGETMAISNNDLQMFDVIGWNLSSGASAPEPQALILLAGVWGLLHATGRMPPRNSRA